METRCRQCGGTRQRVRGMIGWAGECGHKYSAQPQVRRPLWLERPSPRAEDQRAQVPSKHRCRDRKNGAGRFDSEPGAIGSILG